MPANIKWKTVQNQECTLDGIKNKHKIMRVWMPCYTLWKTRVELSSLCDIKPADLLPHDAVEKQGADAFDLAPGCQRPQTHLEVACQQDSEAHQGVVDGISGGGEALWHKYNTFIIDF